MAEQPEEMSVLDRALDEMLKLKDWHGEVRLMVGELKGTVPSSIGPQPVAAFTITAEVSPNISVLDRHELHLGVALVFLGLGQANWSLVIVDAGSTTAAEVLASHLGGEGG